MRNMGLEAIKAMTNQELRDFLGELDEGRKELALTFPVGSPLLEHSEKLIDMVVGEMIDRDQNPPVHKPYDTSFITNIKWHKEEMTYYELMCLGT